MIDGYEAMDTLIVELPTVTDDVERMLFDVIRAVFAHDTRVPGFVGVAGRPASRFERALARRA